MKANRGLVLVLVKPVFSTNESNRCDELKAAHIITSTSAWPRRSEKLSSLICFNMRSFPIKCSTTLEPNYGKLEPDLSFTVLTSVALMTPLAFTSERKLPAPTTCPDRSFVWLTSVLLTVPLPLVSPTSKPTMTLAEETV